MIRIKVSTAAPQFPFVRQIPMGDRWMGCEFVVDSPSDDCDAWVVFDDLAAPQTARCRPENTVLVTWEPPDIKLYDRRFLAQFARVVSCHPNLPHPRVIRSQQGLPWLYGVGLGGGRVASGHMTYPDIREAWGRQPKTKLMSVVSSNKRMTPGHTARLEFVNALTAHFGSEVDVFGRGIRDFDDKREVIDAYRYHIAIENGVVQDYWTEKLADAFLGAAYPIYHGCPNVEDYFGPSGRALTAIDVRRPRDAVRAIEQVIRNDAYSAAVNGGALREAADLVLDRYNLFAMVAGLFARDPATGGRSAMTLRPSSRFNRGARHLIRKVGAKLFVAWPRGRA